MNLRRLLQSDDLSLKPLSSRPLSSNFTASRRASRSRSTNRTSPEIISPLFDSEVRMTPLKRSCSALSLTSEQLSLPRLTPLPLLPVTPVTADDDKCFFDNCNNTMAPFLDLPTEIHQYICELLPNDKDVASYARICVQTSQYVNSSVWHRRFLASFDPIDDPSAEEAHRQYKRRRGFERIYVDFDAGSHPLHTKFLRLLRDMILESDARLSIDSQGTAHFVGRNHEWIRRLMGDAEARRTHSRGTNLVDAICNVEALFLRGASRSSRSTASLVLVVQLCLTHLALDPSICTARAPQFIESQQRVYKSVRDEPIFKGKVKGDINVSWLLHVANFFKFHFKTQDGEGLLAHIYKGFEKAELPRLWCGKIQGGTQELGKCWKGTYTYLGDDDLEAFRDRVGEGAVDEIHQDNNGFQDLTLFFDIKGFPKLQFGPDLEKELHGKPDSRLQNEDESSPEVKDFFGLGYNGIRYHFHGRLHALPPQGGIPGFQRITMMACLPNDAGFYGNEHSAYWGYEGCVLPGNQIMLGRWWRAYTPEDLPSYSGPFIFWATEGSADDRWMDNTAAIKFLNSVEERTI